MAFLQIIKYLCFQKLLYPVSFVVLVLQRGVGLTWPSPGTEIQKTQKAKKVYKDLQVKSKVWDYCVRIGGWGRPMSLWSGGTTYRH